MSKFLFAMGVPDYATDFEKFWKLYPKGVRRDGGGILQGGKDDAAKAWKGLTPERKWRAIKAVKLLKRSEYIPHGGKFLRQNYYDPILENEEQNRTVKSNGRNKAKRNQGEDYTQWIKEQSQSSLEAFIDQMPHMKWLVKKLRPELGF